MINEILYMEIRLISLFSQRNHISRVEANRLFDKYNIWNYIESCYDTLHMNGDEYVLDDIIRIIDGAAA